MNPQARIEVNHLNKEGRKQLQKIKSLELRIIGNQNIKEVTELEIMIKIEKVKNEIIKNKIVLLKLLNK